jgi:hypothetical protein
MIRYWSGSRSMLIDERIFLLTGCGTEFVSRLLQIGVFKSGPLQRNSGFGIKFLLLRWIPHPRTLLSFTNVKKEGWAKQLSCTTTAPGCWRRLCECWWGGTEGFQSLLGSQPAAACGWSPSVSDNSRPALYFSLHFAKKTVSASIKGDKTKRKKYKTPLCTRPKSVQHTRTDMRKYSFGVRVVEPYKL